MRRIALLLMLVGCTLPAFAADRGDDECSAYRQLGLLYQVRSMMMRPYASTYDVDRFLDRALDDLREPLGGGRYRWVRWVRPSGDARIDKHGHTVKASPGATADHFEASGEHAFAVRIAVPQKKSLFSGNNAVSVGTVTVRYSVEGRSKSITERIEQQMNPDTSRTIDLPAIADHVDVALDATTNKPGEALVEIHFKQAEAEDDPNNPNYGAVRTLDRVRYSTDARTIDDEIERLERSLFGGSTSVPMLTILADLRRANELVQSKKEGDVEKGTKLMKETLSRLR